MQREFICRRHGPHAGGMACEVRACGAMRSSRKPQKPLRHFCVSGTETHDIGTGRKATDIHIHRS